MDAAPAPIRSFASRHAPKLQGGHTLGLLTSGQALFEAMAQAMDQARSSIHLETYIFEFQGAPLQVAEALERAGARGISVRLLVDGIGTDAMPDDWQRRFRAAGVQWRVYEPLGKLGLLLPSRWRRLHRKLCVIDGVLGFCGGINLLDDHLGAGSAPLAHPRFDFALRCTGPLVSDMTEALLQLWWRVLALKRVRAHEFSAAWDALLATVSSASGPEYPGGDSGEGREVGRSGATGMRWFGQSAHVQAPPVVHDAPAMLVLRDNVWHRADIERAYLKAIGEARSEVLLANAYFVPGRRMRRALVLAARRGVAVRVLLQGQYEGFMQYHAARPVYQKLVDAGVDVREYTLSALHAKVAVVDGAWATVGSSNLDPLSLLLAKEANVVTADPAFAADLRQRLLHAMAHGATVLDHQALRNRPWQQRVLDRLAFVVMRTLLWLTGHRY